MISKNHFFLKLVGMSMVLTIALCLLNGEYYYRITDVQEDYFYKALLYKDFYRSNIHLILTHPGLPQVFMLSFIMKIFANPIGDAGSVLYIAYFFSVIVNLCSIIYLYNSIKNHDLKIYAVSLVLLWPPFWYYLTCYGADSFVIPLSIFMLCLTWNWLGDKDFKFIELRLVGITQLFIFSVATKISLFPIVCTCSLLIFFKIFFSNLNRFKLLIIFSLCLLEFYLVIKYSFNGIIHILIKWYIGGNAAHLKYNFSNIFSFHIIYILIFIWSFTYIFIDTLKYFLINKNARVMINFYKRSFLLILMLLSLKAISLGGGYDPKALRNASAFVPIFCFSLLFTSDIMAVGLKERFSLMSKLYKTLLFICIVLTVLYVSLHNGNDSIRSLLKTNFSNSFYENNILNPSHYENESLFHYYGNRVYGENKFFIDISKSFPMQ